MQCSCHCVAPTTTCTHQHSRLARPHSIPHTCVSALHPVPCVGARPPPVAECVPAAKHASLQPLAMTACMCTTPSCSATQCWPAPQQHSKQAMPRRVPTHPHPPTPVWVLSLACLAWVSVLPQQPVLQVLQPLGVDCEGLALLGQRKQVHITHCLSIIIILFGGQDKQQGTQRQHSRWHMDNRFGNPPEWRPCTCDARLVRGSTMLLLDEVICNPACPPHKHLRGTLSSKTMHSRPAARWPFTHQSS